MWRMCCVAVLAGGVTRLLLLRRVRVRLVVVWLLLRVAAWLTVLLTLPRLGWLGVVRLSPVRVLLLGAAPLLLALVVLAHLLLVG
jgi:hypothetical protein